MAFKSLLKLVSERYGYFNMRRNAGAASYIFVDDYKSESWLRITTCRLQLHIFRDMSSVLGRFAHSRWYWEIKARSTIKPVV